MRHKQFLKNEFYQQKVAQKVAQLRPLVIKEWMTDNFERIQENADIFDFVLTDEEMAELRKMDTGIALVGNPETPEKTEAAMNW